MAAGMVIGMTACWLTGIALLVYAIGRPAGTTMVAFYVLLVVPAVVGTALCAIRQVRLWARSIVIGLTAGWSLGLVLGCLALISWNA